MGSVVYRGGGDRECTLRKDLPKNQVRHGEGPESVHGGGQGVYTTCKTC